GYAIINNVNNSGPLAAEGAFAENNFSYQPISYGVNADIMMVTDASGIGRFNHGNTSMDIYAGPTNNSALKGQPLCCRIDRVYKSAETLLVADCGTRPLAATSTLLGLDENTCLYFTTNDAKTIQFPIGVAHNPLGGPGGRLNNIVNGSGT